METNPIQQKQDEQINKGSSAEEFKKSTGSDGKGREITFTISETLYPIIEEIKTDLEKEQIQALEQFLSEKKIEDTALIRLPEQRKASEAQITQLKTKIIEWEKELDKEIQTQQSYATKAVKAIALLTTITGIVGVVFEAPIVGTITAVVGGASTKKLFSYSNTTTEAKENPKEEIDNNSECPEILFEKPYSPILRTIMVDLSRSALNKNKKDSLQQCCNEQLENVFIINDYLKKHHELLLMRLKLEKDIEDLKTKTDEEKLHWIKNVAINAIHQLCELGREVPALIEKVIPSAGPVAEAIAPVVDTVLTEAEKATDRKIKAVAASQ